MTTNFLSLRSQVIYMYTVYTPEGYAGVLVIVIARGQGFMVVNEPSPRAKPEDKVCLHCVNGALR